MQETVMSPTEKRSLLSSLLEVLEARERKAQADRQLQEEKYLRRTQRIYDYHDRQRRSAVELRRCLEYVSSHALMLESVLRGAGGGAAGGEVPLGAALVRQASALQRCMAQCVANAARIRSVLHPRTHPQMDSLLAKMESELSTWTTFVQRALDASEHTEFVVDNLRNMIAEQRRCVSEVSGSCVLTDLCGGAGAAAGEGEGGGAGESTGAGDSVGESTTAGESAAGGPARTPPGTPRRRAHVVCSTPIQD